MKELAGKVAVVTGAGSGIGRGMTRAFAEAGMHVFVADIDKEAARKVAADTGGTAVRVDVTNPDDVDALADLAFAHGGAVHLLCNNAGVALGGPLSSMTRDDWRWLLSVNVEGVASCLTAFLPRMKEQGDEAHIVMTGSVLGLGPVAERGVYAATKAAVIAMAEILRLELEQDDIGVTVICPGTVRTRILEAARNRPSVLGNTFVAPPSEFTDAVGAIDPNVLGRQICDAVRANQLYFVPLAESNEMFIASVEKRFDAIRQAMK